MPTKDIDRRLITWKYEDGEEWDGANRFRGSHESDTQKNRNTEEINVALRKIFSKY